MKNPVLTILLLFFICVPGYTQHLNQELAQKNYRVMVGTALQIQWFENTNKSCALKVEVPFSHFWHVGLQLAKIFETSTQYYDDSDPILKGSYEAGVFCKYFFHGRFTGRKSNFYIGPDIRWGVRKYMVYDYDYQTNTYEMGVQNDKTFKTMFNWGIQWRLGKHAVLDVAVPIGSESNTYNKVRTSNGLIGKSSENNFVMQPTMLIGIAF